MVYVRDLEAATRFYTDVVGLSQYIGEGGDPSGPDNTSCKSVFVDAHGVWLQLLQPLGPGTRMDTLNVKGDGYLAETVICVPDLIAFEARMNTAAFGWSMAREGRWTNEVARLR